MHRLKSGLYKIKVPLYEQMIFLAFSEETFDRVYKIRDELKEKSGWAATLVSPDGSAMNFVVFIRTPGDTNTQAHEALHISWHLLSELGVEVDAENHEALAYLVGHVYQKIHEAAQKELALGG